MMAKRCLQAEFFQWNSRNIRFFVQNGSAGLKVEKWDLTEAVKDKEGAE